MKIIFFITLAMMIISCSHNTSNTNNNKDMPVHKPNPLFMEEIMDN